MILDDIVAAKRVLHAARAPRTLDSLWAEAAALPATRPFAAAIRRSGGAPRVIAEFKRRSPSGGDIRPGADPAAIAGEYERAGAAALSILTDEPFFGGRLADLAAARAAAGLPALRKDFMLDERDLVESRLAGADAILLIVRLLPADPLAHLVSVAARLGVAALVEAHQPAEIDAALTAGATIIGVNHRDLDRLTIDLELSRGARAHVGAGVTLVAESGLRGAADLHEMAARDVDAVLVGESLLRAPSPGDALRALVSP